MLESEENAIAELDMANQDASKITSKDSVSRTARVEQRKTRRNRGTLACEECRTRKRKCDGDMPACGSCTKRSSPCVYSSEIQKRAWQTNSIIQSLQSRLEELEKAQASASSPPVASVPQFISPQPHSVSQVHPARSSSVSCSGPLVATDTPMSPPDPESIIVIAQPREIDYSQAQSQDHAEFPRPHTHAALESPHVHVNDEPASAAPSPEALFHRELDPYKEQPPELDQQPTGVTKLMEPIQEVIDHISSHGSSTSPSQSAPPMTVGSPNEKPNGCGCYHAVEKITWCLPLRRQADALVKLYFTSCDRMYPVVHRETFMQQYAMLWEPEDGIPRKNRCSGLCRQTTQGKIFPAMVHMVFALASLFDGTLPDQNSRRAERFFLHTQKLDLFDILDDDVGIELVQLGLLMGFYLQSTEKFSKCWNITGLTIRMAQNMGLQLSLDEARRRGLLKSKATQLECELRLRLWRSCIILDREISMSCGRPLMISTSSNTDRLPQPIDDDLLSTEIGVWNDQPEGVPSSREAFIQLIRLYDILGQILDKEGSGYSTPVSNSGPLQKVSRSDTQTLLSLDSMLTEWQKSLPDFLRYNLFSENESANTDVSMAAMSLYQKLGLDVQAKRLYQKFLHVQMLLLQPALVALFKKQNTPHESGSSDSMKAKFQDLISSGLATQCVASAQTLVIIIHDSMQAGTLPAWWYNIGHLYSCGSIILMGQLCTQLDTTAFTEPLSKTWKDCLHCLSQYVEFSSVAKKSIHLLQTSLNYLGLSNINNSGNYSGPQNSSSSFIDQNKYGPATSIFPGSEGHTEMNIGSIGDSFPENIASESGFMSMPFFSELETMSFDWGMAPTWTQVPSFPQPDDIMMNS